MPYQVPKTTHPWRNYLNRFDKTNGEKKPVVEDNRCKPVKVFLSELVASWEMIEITTYNYGEEGRYSLTEMPQAKIAAWLSNLLKRNYGGQSYRAGEN